MKQSKKVMIKKKAIIYGVKSNQKYHYIGKTIKDIQVKGKISHSKINVQYQKSELHKIFKNNEDVSVEPIKIVPENKWYVEKLNTVVKYKQHPLLNPNWMLEGKRGYWEGKKRDENTLKRLSESKYKAFVEYDINGNFIKVWKSGKEIGIKIFKDYKIVNGTGSTALYDVCTNKYIINRLKHNSYWFKFVELLKRFNGIPNKINIEELIKLDNENKRKNRKPITKITKYSVLCYDKASGKLITTYSNTDDAATKLNLCKGHIYKLCNGRLKSKTIVLKYGTKTTQLFTNKY